MLQVIVIDAEINVPLLLSQFGELLCTNFLYLGAVSVISPKQLHFEHAYSFLYLIPRDESIAFEAAFIYFIYQAL